MANKNDDGIGWDQDHISTESEKNKAKIPTKKQTNMTNNIM